MLEIENLVSGGACPAMQWASKSLPQFVCAVLIIVILINPCQARADNQHATLPPASLLQKWGGTVLRNTLTAFYLPRRRVLSERVVALGHSGRYRPQGQPAFAWSQSMELLMLGEAVKCDSAYAVTLRKFVRTLGPYWRVANGVGGFDVLPGKVPVDRYYDDNGWMTWGFLRAYAATRNRQYLRIAQRDFKFVLSGESSALGGGIFWHEQAKKSKNTCSNGPAIIDALKLYSITRRQAYLRTARRLYVWVNAHLLAHKDYLYCDNIALNGAITRTKWTYNAGTILIANCLFYHLTHQQKYWRRANRIARAAQRRWISPRNGSISGPGVFAWVLMDGYIQLYKIGHDKKWLDLAQRALAYVHKHCQKPPGFYGGSWNDPPRTVKSIKLINQACVGGSYFLLSRTLTQ